MVVVPAVLEGHRLLGVDLPDVRTGGPLQGRGVEQHVVERAREAAVRVRVLRGHAVGARELQRGVGVPGVVQHLQRVLLRVGVEVADQGHCLVGRGDGADPVAQRGGLADAGLVRGALAVTRVGVARPRTGRALGLEVVHDDEERVAAAHGREALADRLARVVEGLAGVGEVAQRPGLAHALDGGGLVDDRVRDDVLSGRVGQLGRRRHERPGPGTGCGVERVDERGERLVRGLAECRAVLDLEQADDVGVERVDRGDDLVLLALERRGVPGAARAVVRAGVHGDGVARAVGVVGAAAERVARRREVVEDVERGELQVATHLLGGRGARVLEVHGVGAAGHGLVRGVELPQVVAEVHDHRLGERDARAHADRVGQRDVGRREAAVGRGEEVDRGAVVEHQGARGVVGSDRGGLGGARAGGVGGLDQRAVAGGQAHLGVLVRRVGVGDREVARGVEHRLEGLAPGVVGGPGGGGGRDGGGVGENDEAGGAADRDLGEAVVLGDGARDLHGLPDGDLLHRGGRVDEDRVRRRVGGRVERAARARRLDDVAVESTGRVRGGDHARGGDGLADERRGRPGALDLGDGVGVGGGGRGGGERQPGRQGDCGGDERGERPPAPSSVSGRDGHTGSSVSDAL